MMNEGAMFFVEFNDILLIFIENAFCEPVVVYPLLTIRLDYLTPMLGNYCDLAIDS